MSLLARLFSPRKTYKKEKLIESPCKASTKESRPFGFSVDKNNVRILLFRECDWRGRKLLFDSTSVEKISLDPKIPLTRPRSNSSDMVVELSNGFGYKYKKPHADTNTLGEMIFGSIAMVTRGTSMKVHLMKDPPRIMFTKIIQAPRSGVRKRQISDEKTLEDSQSSSVNSMGEYNSGSFGSKSGSFEATLDDSGFVSLPPSSQPSSSQHCSCTSCPLHPSSVFHTTGDASHANSNSSLQSGGSLSSLRRRWARSVTTTLDLNDPPPALLPTGKRTKLGIALIIPLSQLDSQKMEQYLLDCLPLVNNILTRLQHSTERAYCRRDVFVQSMFQASINAVQSVCELVGGPRMDHPLWLTLTSEQTDAVTRSDLEQRLVSDLSYLLTSLDTKHTNFFVSTLLTAVLTHHLGWVPTVMSDLPQHSQSMFDEFSRSHPYNPLWAQLSDLQGALGYPPKVAKTVIVGKSESLVQQLLSVLSYFIRCGHIRVRDLERESSCQEEDYLEDLLENKQEKRLFDKDAIREFSKAGSLEGSASSSSTLTKSKTMLSMKTFSVNDSDVDNANSLESGFESCNEFSGESYEEGNRIGKSTPVLASKLRENKGSANLMETSFSQKTITDSNALPNRKMTLSPSVSTHSSFIKCIETDHKMFSKIDSEKQYSSAHVLDVKNQTNSKILLGSDKSRSSSFIKENLIRSDLVETEDKTSKVVFVLGENEELVNIKGQSEANIAEICCCSSPLAISNKMHVQPPIILVNDADAEDIDPQREKNAVTGTGFVTGDISSRVVISHSISIKLEDAIDSKKLKPKQLHRCLSVPEEAVLEMDWVKKRRRSREMIQLIRKWLSDSDIERTSHNPLCRLTSSENTISLTQENKIAHASVFRTSNRSLKDAVVEPDQSVEKFASENDCDVPSNKVDRTDVCSPLPLDEYVELPSQSSIVIDGGRTVSVAASVFGVINDNYSPEMVLQGLTGVSPGWLTDLRHSLALEAHSSDLGCDSTEAICVVANVDTREVLLVSSHSVRAEPGVRVGMSQLVANLLETTQHLCHLSLPPSVCLSHVETKLEEFCVRSQALAELLLTSDFLDVATLTSVLDLDPNDVPLLLSVASAHTPLVTSKYGLSYQ